MGNAMDRVMEGLYVGGFLGEIEQYRWLHSLLCGASSYYWKNVGVDTTMHGCKFPLCSVPLTIYCCYGHAGLIFMVIGTLNRLHQPCDVGDLCTLAVPKVQASVFNIDYMPTVVY